MDVRNAGMGATLVGIVLALVDLSPAYVNQQLVGDGGNWLPRFERTSRTILFYNYASRGVSFVVAVGAVLALGYLAGSRLDLQADYRRLVLALGLGGLLGYLLAQVVVVWLLSDGAVLGDTAILTGALFLARPIAVALEFAVVGFAGAAFAALVGESGTDGDRASSSSDGDVRPGSAE